jgi:hypothetical protein
MKKRKFEFTGNITTQFLFIPLFMVYRFFGLVGKKSFDRRQKSD